jgi:3D (Asp-Asp-Asp) domain-containing protein
MIQNIIMLSYFIATPIFADTLTPTVYYTPTIDTTKATCPKNKRVNVKGEKNVTIVTLCPDDYQKLSTEGAAIIITTRGRFLVNFLERRNGVSIYFVGTQCLFGYATQNRCLTPFKSIAADLDRYNVGDKIFVPKVKGLKLPDGSTHDGWFVIVDAGEDIKGKGRFDFFSGTYTDQDKENPFVKIGLNDKKNKFEYTLTPARRPKAGHKSHDQNMQSDSSSSSAHQ